MFATCVEIPGATSNGEGSGLSRVESVTVSADGRWVYAAGRSDHAIARFKRDGSTGALSYKGCISGQSGLPCNAIRTAVLGGDDSGLANVRSIALSRDGESAYAVAADDDAIARFDVGRRGKLRYRGCIGGDSEAPCKQLPRAAPEGTDSGLDHPKSLTLSRDGRWLYAAATSDASIVRFSRNPRNGRLKFSGCVTGEIESGPGGSRACKRIGDIRPNGDNSGLADARGLAISPDQRWLYGVSSDDDAVFRFERGRSSGKLKYRGCLTGESESVPACRPVEAASSFGANPASTTSAR